MNKIAWVAGVTLAAAGLWAQTPRAPRADQPQLSFSVALDNSVYIENLLPPAPPSPGPVLTAKLTLRNTAQPITLEFPTGQNYDLEIRDAGGTVVYRWSDGRAFPQVFRTEKSGPGEKTFLVQAPLAGADKNPLPEGKYVAEVWLTTRGGKRFDASVGFEIRRVQ